MGNLVTLMVAASIGSFLSIPILNLSVATVRSRADLEARLLYEAEIDHAKLIWSQNFQTFSNTWQIQNPKCTTGSEHGVITTGFIIDITCTVGGRTAGSQTVKLSLPENDLQTGGLGVFSDEDKNGYDDVTGLPTHYWGCYSAWSGQNGSGNSGQIKSSCELGGDLVIPAYAHLY